MTRVVLLVASFAVSMALGVWGLQAAKSRSLDDLAIAKWLPSRRAAENPTNPGDSVSKAGSQHAQSRLIDRWPSLTWQEREDFLKDQRYVRLDTEEGPIAGRVLTWDPVQVALLSDQGHLKFVPWVHQVSITPINRESATLSRTQQQQALQAEFGSHFVIRNSTQFSVLQPASSQRDWARSMQQFYGNVLTYCGDRNIRMRAPEHPLVAIVFSDRASMVQYAKQQGENLGDHVLAYYSVNTNRVAMYDPSSGLSNRRTANRSDSLELELETVFHEAFHQVAFNTGLHYRTTPPPMWVSEGMATAFETAGLADHRRSKSIADRVHRHHLRLLQEFVHEPGFKSTVAQLLRDDGLFQSDPTKAYALSWALAFYWLEQAPHEFSNFLTRINRREMFTSETSDQRQADFRTLCRCSVPEFTDRLVQFYQQFK